MQYSTLGVLVTALHHQKKSKSFIRYGSNACWIHTITIKHKYKLDNKDIKNIVKRTPGLTISNRNYIHSTGYRSFGIVQFEF